MSTDTSDSELAAINRDIRGKNTGQIRELRDRTLREIADIGDTIAGHAAGRPLMSRSSSSGAVPIRILEQNAVHLQRRAHFLDLSLPASIQLNVSPFYTPAESVPTAGVDPELLMVYLVTIGKNAADLATFRNDLASRVIKLKAEVAIRHEEMRDNAAVSHRNFLDSQQVVRMERELAYVDGLLEAPAAA